MCYHLRVVLQFFRRLRRGDGKKKPPPNRYCDERGEKNRGGMTKRPAETMFFTLHAARGISFSFARRTREWYAIIASRKQSALLVLTSSKLIVSKVYTRALGGFYTDESEKKKRTIIFIDIISPPRTNNNLRSLHGGKGGNNDKFADGKACKKERISSSIYGNAAEVRNQRACIYYT